MSFKDRDKVIVTHYYYIIGLTQQEIADKLGMSRQRVNRLLKQALAEGVVQIKVPGYENAVLENELERKLGLRDAVVVSGGDIGELAAAGIRYLKSVVSDGWNIGVSGGTTIAELCKAPVSDEKHDIKVVQMMGGMITSSLYTRPDEVTSKFAKIFGGEAYIMLAPAIVDEPELVRLLMEDSQFREIRSMYSKLDVAVVSAGTLTEDAVLFSVGYLSRKDFEMLREKNSVGDVLMRFIDIDGNIVDPSLDERVISIPLEEFKKIGIRVGVSYGPTKVNPLMAAINGNFINVLITDSDTATGLLAFHR